MKRIVTWVLCCFVTLSLWSQVPYGYAPANPTDEEISALGSNKNGFVQGLVLFDPATDPVLQRLKGQKINGVRCYLRADYKQARQKRSAVLASEGTPDNIVCISYADFTAGWNDVFFETPLTIGDEKIYLGLQAYETVGTPYPLTAYSKATVPQSCFVNLAKTSWDEYTDRGTLLVLALLDDNCVSQFDHSVYAQNTTHPQTVAPDQDFTGGLYIHNFTPYPIDNLEIAMQGEGAAEPTMKDIELPTTLEAYGSTVITTQLRAGSTEGTSVDWTCTVTNVNQSEAQTARPGTTKLYVTYDNFQRVPLIEEFTSQRCVNCPQMAYFLEKALEEYAKPYVYLSHHSGFHDDSFTSDVDKELVYIFGGYQNEYNPAIMYNRAVLEGESAVIQGIRQMAPDPYLEALALASEMPAMAEVNMIINNETIRINGRIARDLIDQPLHLSCYLVEDGIPIDRYPQLGMDDDDAPSDLKDVFRHNGVILHHFTTNAIGDMLSINNDGTYSVCYPTVTKEGFGGTAKRIVALVHKINKDDLHDNQVLNVAQLSLKEETDGIHTQTNRQSLPSCNAIYDLQGRRITKPASKGIYMIKGRKVII